jgi:hypothetical protein
MVRRDADNHPDLDRLVGVRSDLHLRRGRSDFRRRPTRTLEELVDRLVEIGAVRRDADCTSEVASDYFRGK